MITPETWRGVLALIVVGAGLGLGYNALNPKPLPWVTEAKKGVRLEALADTPVAEASPAEASAGTSSAPPAATRPEPIASTESVKVPAPASGMGGAEAATPRAGDPEPEPATDAAADPYADIPASEYPIELDLAQAASLYARGGLLVLDARDPEEFEEGHIRGAVNAPYNTVAGDTGWFDRAAAEPRPILAYCGGGNCELSMDLAFELVRAGHPRVLVLMDGFEAWKDGAHPVSMGEAP